MKIVGKAGQADPFKWTDFPLVRVQGNLFKLGSAVVAIWNQELLPWYQGRKLKTVSTKWQLMFKQKAATEIHCGSCCRKERFELSNVISRKSSFKRARVRKRVSLLPHSPHMCQSLRCSEISWCPHPNKELQCKISLHPCVLLSWTCCSVPPTNCASHTLLFKSLYVHKTPHKPVSVCSSTLSVGGRVWVWTGKILQSLHFPNPGKERGDSKGEKVHNTGQETRPIPWNLSYHNTII